MPRRYQKKKPYKKKRKYPVKRRRRRLTSMGVPSGMPTQRLAKLRFCTTGRLSSVSGVIDSASFVANGIFGVDITSGSPAGQPMGFDQWATLFNHYVVLGSRISVEWALEEQNQSFVAGTYLNDDNTLIYTKFADFKQARKGSQRVLVNQRNRVITSSNFSAKKYFNVKDVKDNTDRLGGSITSNPSEQAIFVIYGQAMDGASNVNARYLATIDFIVLWSEPRDIPISS